MKINPDNIARFFISPICSQTTDVPDCRHKCTITFNNSLMATVDLGPNEIALLMNSSLKNRIDNECRRHFSNQENSFIGNIDDRACEILAQAMKNIKNWPDACLNRPQRERRFSREAP